MMVFFWTRPGKILIWRKSSGTWESDFKSLLSKSMDWFLNGRDLRHERVNSTSKSTSIIKTAQISTTLWTKIIVIIQIPKNFLNTSRIHSKEIWGSSFIAESLVSLNIEKKFLRQDFIGLFRQTITISMLYINVQSCKLKKHGQVIVS